MSRIGNAIITIPAGVTVELKDSVVKVKGSKGELEQAIDSCVTVAINGTEITLERESDHPDHRSKHGLYRSLIANMIEGCANGYKKQLELVGVGFRAKVSGQTLEVSLGYSHPIVFEMAKEIKVTAETEKGKNPIVTLEYQSLTKEKELNT